MGNNKDVTTTILSEPEVIKKNTDLIDQLHLALDDNQKGIIKLRSKLSATFWTLIVLSITTFIIGIILLIIPAISAFDGEIDKFKSLIAGGFGIADLFGLALYKPMEKIHKLMGDMSQLILALNCNQTQISLRLIEMDVINNRPSIGIAAEKICSATEGNIRTIQKFFEEAEEIQKPPISN